LFLTTNRVGNIDRAFKSRIHVALYYPKLSKDATLEIWKRNIKRIKADFKKEGKPFEIEEKDLLRYSKEHFKELKAAKFLTWNGRQIRNAFQTAIALAEYDAAPGRTPVLNRKYFEKVAVASKDFDQYLKDTQKGKDDAQIAREEKTRFDEFGEYDEHSRIVDEGIVWDRRNIRPTIPVTRTIQRRSSFVPSKGKARREEVVSEESEESSESDLSVESGNESDDAGAVAEAQSEDDVNVSSEEEVPMKATSSRSKSNAKQASKKTESKASSKSKKKKITKE
jgi:hypothetical protein